MELAREQIMRAVETVMLLEKAVRCFAENDVSGMNRHVNELFQAEAKVDALRTEVFMELSKGEALIADYREDLMHVVKRLDMVADNVKDAARCLRILEKATLPPELLGKIVNMVEKLVQCVQALQSSIEKLSSNPEEATAYANKVAEVEHEIDKDYLSTKAMLPKLGKQVNIGSVIVFDDLVEFVEHASDLCADTADYIVVLASRE